jgi:hypothetical protein
MGNDFVAHIRHKATGKYITDVNDNLEIADGTFGSSRENFYANGTQAFHFIYNEDDGTYSILNDAKGKWFDVSGGIYEDGTNMWLYQGNGLDTQRFYVYYINNNFYFRCKASTKVFDVAADTGNLALWGDNTGTNDVSAAARAFEILKINMDYGQWYLNYGADDIVYVRNVSSGLLMTANEGDVYFGGASYTDNQKWKLLRRADGSYEFVSVSTGKYLDVAESSMTDGTKVNLWDCNGQKNQAFYILPSGEEGYCVIKPCYTNHVFDMAADTKNLALYAPHLDWEVPRAAQLFEIVFEDIVDNTIPAVNLGTEFEASIVDKQYNQALTDMDNGVLESHKITGEDNQTFKFYYDATTNSYEIVGSTGRALDVTMTNYKNASVIGMYDRNNWVAQRFRLHEVDGYYAISPIHTNRLVDIDAEGLTTVQLYGTTTGDNRLFSIVKKEPEPAPEPEVKDKITLITSSDYAMDGKLVLDVKSETEAQQLLTQFENEGLKVMDKNGKLISGSDVVGTGATVNLYKGDEIVDTVTIVVLGDVDGNGVIDTTDCVRVKAAFLGVYTLSAAEAIAADVDKNGTIDTTDFVRVKAHFLGTYDLHQ